VRIAIDARAAAEVPAGRGRYVRELIRALARSSADHHFVLYARVPWTEVELDARFAWSLVSAPGLSWPLKVGAQMSAAADVALACTSYAITAPWRIPGAAIVWDFAPFQRRLRPPLGSLLERLTLPLALRRAASLIAISQATRAELEQRFPRARGRTAVATPAADTRFAPHSGPADAAVLARHGLQKPYLLVTGTLEPRKNVPRLIEAFTGLAPQERAGWTLALAGAPGWQTDHTLSAAGAHPGLVRRLGYVADEDLPALYRHAELFAYVSLYEGFGIPVLEAMQSGTAVLTSDVSSMPEVGGDAARYADPIDVADIRRGLRELLVDPQLRAACERRGLEQAKCFSWSATASRVLEVLADIGSGPTNRPR
jgi:glycosyltransferase involved in cell wall biosynthesis